MAEQTDLQTMLQKKMLIIEDSEVNLEMLSDYAEQAGYVPVKASQGFEGLAAYINESYSAHSVPSAEGISLDGKLYMETELPELVNAVRERYSFNPSAIDFVLTDYNYTPLGGGKTLYWIGQLDQSEKRVPKCVITGNINADEIEDFTNKIGSYATLRKPVGYKVFADTIAEAEKSRK